MAFSNNQEVISAPTTARGAPSAAPEMLGEGDAHGGESQKVLFLQATNREREESRKEEASANHVNAFVDL